MRILLIELPLAQATPSGVYGHAVFDTAAPHAPPRVQQAALNLLPGIGRDNETVALVPACALSWHRVTLPAGLGKQATRLLAALRGLLEEHLLQDPAHLHLALPPQWRTGDALWVCACDLQWLRAHLQALEQAGHPVRRIVPEFAPPLHGQIAHAVGDADTGWLWCADAQHGISGWPVVHLSQLPEGWLHPDTPVPCEPALVAAVQTRGLQADLTDTAAHWRNALSSGWDLAQFALQSDAGSRWRQRLRRQLDKLWRAPDWRPARWGLAALLLTQLIGLNAWAWRTRHQWQVQEDGWKHMLQESFPKVTAVVDAPLQMAREVERLRQGSGQLAPGDMETMLAALGSALPVDVATPQRLIYQGGTGSTSAQLQWPEASLTGLSASQMTTLRQTLQQQGYSLQQDKGSWRLRLKEADR